MQQPITNQYNVLEKRLTNGNIYEIKRKTSVGYDIIAGTDSCWFVKDRFQEVYVPVNLFELLTMGEQTLKEKT